MATDLERFVGADGRTDLVKDVRRRIDAEGITYVYYQFPSVTGRIMGKGVPAQHWETIAEKGFQLVYGATANLFTDRHGNYIGTGRRPPSWSEFRSRRPSSRSLGREGRACVVHLLPQPRGAQGPRRVPLLRLPRNLKRMQAAFEEATGLHLRAGPSPR